MQPVRIRNSFERTPMVCQNRFWVLPSEHRVVAENHPGAVEVPCHRCLACLIVKRNQHIGRMTAQAQDSSAMAFVTLTYAPGPDGVDPEGAKSIVKKHMVDFRKLVRNRYGQTQYSGVAERGDLKGRVHWHVLFYFTEANKLPEWQKLPSVVERDYLNAVRSGAVDGKGGFRSCGYRCELQPSTKKVGRARFIAWIPEWPHGYINIREVDAGTPGYIAKYMMSFSKGKVLRGETSAHNSRETYKFCSNKLGLDFVRREGERTAAAGLNPVATYRIADRKFTRGPRKGQFVEFTMTKAMRREYNHGFMAYHAKAGKPWRARISDNEHDALGKLLDADAAADPLRLAEKFFEGLDGKQPRGQAQLPYVHLGKIAHVISTADQGLVVLTSRGEAVFQWPDLSGHGRDVVIPIKTRRELFSVVRKGAVQTFGLLRPDHDTLLVVRSEALGLKQRVTRVGGEAVYGLCQTLEHGGSGLANARQRQEAAEAHLRRAAEWHAAGELGEFPSRRMLHWKVQRALVTGPQLDGLRRRIIDLLVARWKPPRERLAHGVRAIGLPSRFDGTSMTLAEREEYPLFARWFLEAHPDAAPF